MRGGRRWQALTWSPSAPRGHNCRLWHAGDLGGALALLLATPALGQTDSPSPSPCPILYTVVGANDTFDGDNPGDWQGASTAFCGLRSVLGGWWDLG